VEELGIEVRVILNLILTKYDVSRINLAQDNNQWQTLENMVMNFRFTQKEGNFLTIWVTLTL